MKTTIDLPDDLVKAAKLRAVHENRRLKDVVADALRRGLAESDATHTDRSHRVELPLIESRPVTMSDEELTPERVDAILRADEVAELTR